jgi:hypothetical protein
MDQAKAEKIKAWQKRLEGAFTHKDLGMGNAATFVLGAVADATTVGVWLRAGAGHFLVGYQQLLRGVLGGLFTLAAAVIAWHAVRTQIIAADANIERQLVLLPMSPASSARLCIAPAITRERHPARQGGVL